MDFLIAAAAAAALGPTAAVPADLLLENGHIFMFSSAAIALLLLTFPFLSFFFSAPVGLFWSFFLKISFHLLDEIKLDDDKIEGCGAGVSGSVDGGLSDAGLMSESGTGDVGLTDAGFG